jgi:hypothetical protein
MSRRGAALLCGAGNADQWLPLRAVSRNLGESARWATIRSLARRVARQAIRFTAGQSCEQLGS